MLKLCASSLKGPDKLYLRDIIICVKALINFCDPQCIVSTTFSIILVRYISFFRPLDYSINMCFVNTKCFVGQKRGERYLSRKTTDNAMVRMKQTKRHTTVYKHNIVIKRPSNTDLTKTRG